MLKEAIKKEEQFKKTRKVIEMLKCNIWTLLGFDFLFKIISALIIKPLFWNIFNFTMKLTGYSYLTKENIIEFLLNPFTLLLLLGLIMIMTVYNMFDITTVIVILDQSYQEKKINIINSIKLSFSKCIKMMKLRNLPLAFFVLFLIPFLQIGVASSFVHNINIPEFILKTIEENNMLSIIFYIAMALLTTLFMRWIYSIHYFVLEDVSFKEARKKSTVLGKDKHFKDLFALISIQILIAIGYILFIAFGVFGIITFSNIFKNIIIAKSIFTTIIWVLMAISFVALEILSTPISYACISVLFYLHKKEKREQVKSIGILNTKQKTLWTDTTKGYLVILISVIIIISSLFSYGIYRGWYNLNTNKTRTLEVTAHRGASIDYPENTMSAFVGAKELGADWIELDVQQTKDGKIIVFHDKNFKRVTGVNANTWELTYDEISHLNAANYFDEKEFVISDSTTLEPSSDNYEKIPLLEEVIEFAKESDIKLNIELKPTGHEINFEKSVIDIINRLDFRNECVITSQVYEVLERVKEYDKNIETVYVMSLAYGDIAPLEAADNFSIEATSVTKKLVKRIHKKGKKLYAWTVNTEENIRKMIELNVDNIITDDVTLSKEIIDSSKNTNLIDKYVRFVERIF